MKKIKKIIVIITIVGVLICSNNYNVLGANGSVICTDPGKVIQMPIEGGVAAETLEGKESDGGHTVESGAPHHNPNEDPYYEIHATLNDGTKIDFFAFATKTGASALNRTGNTGVDLSKELDGQPPFYMKDGNVIPSSANEALDNFWNSLCDDNGIISDYGIEFLEQRTGKTYDKQSGTEAINNVQFKAETTMTVQDADGKLTPYNNLNKDKVNGQYKGQNYLYFQEKMISNSMTDNTDGSNTIGRGGTSTGIPSNKTGITRIPPKCNKCGEYKKPGNPPEPPKENSLDCPELKICESECEYPESKECSSTNIIDNGCYGYIYNDSTDVMYCSGKVGTVVSGTNELSHYYCYEYGSVSTPFTPSVTYAGRGFNLSGNFSASETRVCVKDDGQGVYAYYNTIKTEYDNILSSLLCTQKNKTLKEKYRDELLSYKSSLEEIANGSCGWYCPVATIKNEKGEEECPVSEEYDNSCDDARKAIPGVEAEISKTEGEIENLRLELIELMKSATKYYGELKTAESYVKAYQAAPSSNTQTSSSISVSNPVAKFSKFVFEANQINRVNKNSATYNTITNESNSMPINYQFFIPSEVKNNTRGNVSANVSNIGIELNLSFNWSCDFDILNYVYCKNGQKCGDDYAIIYRPISLIDPFPNRPSGANWTDEMVDKIIKNNRDVENYDIYNLDPMYTIVLTPSVIKKIREYNDTSSYSSFDNMKCSNGINCRSEFLTNNTIFEKEISGCGMSSDWNACFSESLANYKANITNGINIKKGVNSLVSEGAALQ